MIGIPGLSIPRRRRATAAASYPLLDSLVAYWNLSEASGQRNDSHTNALHLTDNNTVASATGPDGGTAASFAAASSEYLSRASESALQAGNIDYTYNVWLRPDGVANGGTVIKRDVIGGRELLLRYSSSSVKMDYYAYDGTAYSGEVGVAATDATWQMLTIWHSGGTIAIAKNAGSAITASATLGLGNGSAPLRIGDGWNGRIAYVGFWKRMLTAAERTWLYNSGSGRNYAAVAAYTG